MSLNRKMLEEVTHFIYLRSQIGREGGVEVDVSFRVEEARRASDTVRKLWKNRGLRVEAKMLCQGIVVPTALYGGRNVGLERSREEEVGHF